ncbi:pollen-specific leucine-rich repeat extensin-like protein 2 [Lingula anatina]|uniref:Pollen-specific leucine-rich repeat extensin-like protein 2 n=1 Tax=Lingula anatina TaxID=7574 RepID=A0A1S3IXA9_LINAN|nr:pollen-specific leucine-rich repeat extensin-like protein 2 [Lingula anatina]XP_013402601.1 pollen-specific leucine-rich repeat extensin-like protein 2 [Lingula anatina]XP_013402602.1 pollen-specific leucine-rich repeat extensin-like protein 2 [Lingula anatina]XP_013402603.1 pollen-specific leucine-rich repeat extensin-like protein 2 [Lingula anatina]XP_013402604.1 pollen-specific leucine-rich repeat extensin-like protein 2 [Lingula anatina]|eukprot:XP_013402600.1 pollen-specific leucine-rich repeat extensin-like protein 2 [Lingula anatina]
MAVTSPVQHEGFGNLDEFDQPSPLRSAYCSQMTEDEYEEQTATETEKALRELIQHLKSDPVTYHKILKKKKQEEIENSGVFSYLKCKLFMAVQGENYVENMITEEESKQKLNELTCGMEKAFEYAQEAKGRRFSKRIAARKSKRASLNDENTPTGKKSFPPPPCVPPPPPPASIPPPPPPPPPSQNPMFLIQQPTPRRPLTPLTDRLNIQTPLKSTVTNLKESSRLAGSTTSLSSIHSELLSVGSNPMKRLRATGVKSPGGTPLNNLKQVSNDSGADLNCTPSRDSLHRAFVTIMKQKFRNVRTPSPSPNSLCTSVVSPVNTFSP